MKKLYKFHLDCGRNGDLDGLFIADDSEVKKLIGKVISFGEVLGKHSDVEAKMTRKLFTAIDIPADALGVLEEHLGETLSGYNPFEYRAE